MARRYFKILIFSLTVVLFLAKGVSGFAQVLVSPPEEAAKLKQIRIAVPFKKHPGFSLFEKFLSEKMKLKVRLLPNASKAQSGLLLREGKAEFAWMTAESFVILADQMKAISVAAVLEKDGQYGLQTALVVRPDSTFENEQDVLRSDARIGYVAMAGIRGRFYQSLLTDENWQLLQELKEKNRALKLANFKVLIDSLKAPAQKNRERRIEAALIPIRELGEIDAEGLRAGLKELWLSPLYPDDVIASRSDIGKRLRYRLGAALVDVGNDPKLLAPFDAGGFRLTEDSAFEVIREYMDRPEQPGVPKVR